MTNTVTKRKGVGVWIADLAMGFRFAVAGGRSGWIRAGLTALGVALAVAMLLVAASVPTIVANETDRSSRLYPQYAEPEDGVDAADALLVESRSSTFHGLRIKGHLVQPTSFDSPIPPGLDALPEPGDVYLSPALAELLASDEGELLKPRIDFRVAGTIDDSGLFGPGNLTFWAGSDQLDPSFANQVTGYGADPGPQPLSPILVMLVLVAATIMLLPVVMFMAVAVRFGGERRDRRLAALRLVGADQAMTRRVAAGESLLGALLGLALGWILFEVGTRILINAGTIEYVTSGALSYFVSDVAPDPMFATIVVLAVPVVAVFATQLAMRRLVVEPLGVVRNAKPTRRRLWWRLALAALGVAALVTPQILDNLGDLKQTAVVFGVLTLLLGVAAILPWIVERAVGRLRGGAPSWQLAVRRLQLGGGSAFRAVVGVAVAAAGAIALQMLFNAIQTDEVRYTGADPNVTNLVSTGNPADPDAVADAVADIDGAEVKQQYTTLYGNAGDHDVTVLVVDCGDMPAVAAVDDCDEGDVYSVADVDVVASGTTLSLWASTGNAMTEAEWRIPEVDGEATLNGWEDNYQVPSLIVTSAAFDSELREFLIHTVKVKTDPSRPDAIEAVRNVAATQIPLWTANTNDAEEMSDTFAKLRDTLLLGVAATMILIGLSLLVNTIEQLQERRRVMSVLVAFGVRRRSLILSVLWQTAIPVMLALLVATGAGIGLGNLLVSITVYEPVIDWSSVAAFSGVGAAMVLLVTLLSLPALWRMMRPDGIRTE